MDFAAAIEKMMPAVVELRHRLHRIPELAYEEFQTAGAVRNELDRLKIPHIDGVSDAPTATIAMIGDSSKPCIALRSDIDALPIAELTGLPYASRRPGFMHACGHDGHMATLLGTAEILKSMEDRLSVCVKLIWQPAEEGGAGAARLVKAGALDGRIGPKPAAIFGLHGWPALPVGTVATKPGAILAATNNFLATFVGRGCHGAFPHLGVDPILTAAEAVVNLQQFVSREMDPTDSAVITVGKFNAGTATNVIPDSATIEGTARTLNDESRKKIQSAIHRRCSGIASANDCDLKFQWFEGYPSTINDAAMADYVAKIARETVGADRYLPVARPSMGGEDFAFYLEQIPGCFFFVGVQPLGHGTYPPLHNAHYDFTDAALGVGMRMFVNLVMGWSERG